MTPKLIEKAPKDGTEILAWHKHRGWFIASHTSPSGFPLTQKEIDEMDEETLFASDWFTQWPAAERLEGSEVPTHWLPLPPYPDEVKP
jgi:diadenosine tetraphosphatase ApaH/serine/threonine PP2A family protein phosphatase